MTAALEGGKWSAARPPPHFPPGKTRYPFYRSLGGPKGPAGREENLAPTGIRSRTVQPVVSRYSDWATQPTASCMILEENEAEEDGLDASRLGTRAHKMRSG